MKLIEHLVEPEESCSTDLAVLLLGDEPLIMREAYATADAARHHGYSAVVLELAGPCVDQITASRLGGHRPRLVALGLCRASFSQALGLAEQVRREHGVPLILFGRDLALEADRKLVPIEAAIGVAVGNAPAVVLDCLRALGGDGKTLSSEIPVAGLDRLDGDFRPRSFSPPGLPGALVRFYEADFVRLRRDGLPIATSLGCPRRCAFCGEQPREGSYRVRSALEVVAEMAFHREQNDVRRFQICDLVLNGDLRHLEAICDLLLEKKLDVTWWGRALVDPEMPRELYRKMRLAGCVGLELEVISGSDSLLSRMKTEHTADDASIALRRASVAGIATRISLVVGLPGEAEIELGETVAWLQQNRFHIGQVKDIVPCALREGSTLLRRAGSYGVVLPLEDPCRGWHDGGYNTPAHREKRAAELRVFVEDALGLEVVGEAPSVSWDSATRASIVARLERAGAAALAQTGRFRRENLSLGGVLRRGKAAGGPPNLEIDLTNNCNQHCAGCWIHSFLLGDERISGEKRRATLDYQRVVELVESARRLGTKRIQLSGAGEPFMHPQIDEILALIKDADIELDVITNFTLVDESRARRLVDLGVDTVTVSLWAGTPRTYARTHPTAKEELFRQVVDVISHLTWYRRATGASRPRVKIYNVISALNFHEINEMIDVAREMGADLIEFTPIDIVKGRTDELALSQQDAQIILDQLINVRRRPDYLQRTAEEASEGRLPGIEEQGEFARFFQGHRLSQDFCHSLTDIRCWEAHCRRGVHSSRVYEEIHRDSAIFFSFPASECRACMAFVDCSIEPFALNVRAPYLSLQGFGSFWRRVSGSGGESGRDARIVDRIPCAIGYTYARVQATGHVIPCCKAAAFPLGNILESSFEDVWFSPAYEEFRVKAITLPKSDPYFAPMECYKVCDNLGHNMTTQEEVSRLPGPCRAVLLEE